MTHASSQSCHTNAARDDEVGTRESSCGTALRGMPRRRYGYWFIGRQSMPLISRDTELARVTPTSGFRRSLARVADFVALTKPRVMSLVVFTALVGLTLAPEPLGQRRAVIILLCI